jgi:acetylornithine deacetylase
LTRLVAFDTTSRNSNLELIHHIRDYLDDHGMKSTLVPNEDGTKANLFASSPARRWTPAMPSRAR